MGDVAPTHTTGKVPGYQVPSEGTVSRVQYLVVIKRVCKWLASFVTIILVIGDQSPVLTSHCQLVTEEGQLCLAANH